MPQNTLYLDWSGVHGRVPRQLSHTVGICAFMQVYASVKRGEMEHISFVDPCYVGKY